MVVTTPKRSELALPGAALQQSAALWGYLLLVTLAELVTATASPQLGQLMHVLLLAGLALHAALARRMAARRFLLALTLAPLIRILSLSLPLTRFPQLAWYPIVAIPLLITSWVIVRQLKLSGWGLGLRLGSLPLQLGIATIGVVLGVTEYYILAPRPQFAEPTWQAFGLAALNLLIFTGFCEEVIFRGVLQSVGPRVLGRWSLLYISLLFGVLHIGYLSLLDVLFVSGVGLLFAYLVRWTGSIFGVTLAHGITNSMLFLVMPQLSATPALRESHWAVGTLILSGAVAAATLAAIIAPQLRARTARQLQPAGALVRERRRAARLTYPALAARSGLPAGVLAEIEHGLRHPLPEELRRIEQAIAAAPLPAAHLQPTPQPGIQE